MIRAYCRWTSLRERYWISLHASGLCCDVLNSMRLDPPTNVKAADWRTGGGTAAVEVTAEGCRVFHVGGDNPHVVMEVPPGDRLFVRSDGQRSTQLFVGLFAESHQPAAAQRTYLEPESWYVATAPLSPDGRRWSIRVDPPVGSNRLDLCVAGPPPAPPVSIVLDRVLTGLDLPVFVTHAGDGSRRLFVVERGGAGVGGRRRSAVCARKSQPDGPGLHVHG
jgi:hypothetical protein